MTTASSLIWMLSESLGFTPASSTFLSSTLPLKSMRKVKSRLCLWLDHPIGVSTIGLPAAVITLENLPLNCNAYTTTSRNSHSVRSYFDVWYCVFVVLLAYIYYPVWWGREWISSEVMCVRPWVHTSACILVWLRVCKFACVMCVCLYYCPNCVLCT